MRGRIRGHSFGYGFFFCVEGNKKYTRSMVRCGKCGKLNLCEESTIMAEFL